jgi:hypothetical protein
MALILAALAPCIPAPVARIGNAADGQRLCLGSRETEHRFKGSIDIHDRARGHVGNTDRLGVVKVQDFSQSVGNHVRPGFRGQGGCGCHGLPLQGCLRGRLLRSGAVHYENSV